MTFEFSTASRIIFGAGKLTGIGPTVRALGQRAFVVVGRHPRHGDRLQRELAAAQVNVTRFVVAHEPTTDLIVAAVAAARDAAAEVVIGLGGGSVLDAAKAVAVMLTNSGELTDYLEVIGQGRPLACAAVPCVAIPTTAGTGSEVTRNAVLASPSHRVKVSLRSASMLPRVAVVDPELTYDLPPALTATTGMDALTQVIEPYVSCRANPLVDGFCVEGMRRAAGSLRRAVTAGSDAGAREDMAFASLCGGLALANAGLGAVHGFAGPVGGAFPAPHGAVCAALLPGVTAMNLRALRARMPESGVLRRYEEVARLLTARPQATADDAAVWLAELVRELQIPRLSAYGVRVSDVPALVAAAMQASSMKANPLPLTAAECAEILSAAI